MAYEASEIMTAVALQYPITHLEKIQRTGNLDDLCKLISDGILSGKNLVQFGNSAIKDGFEKLLKPDDLAKQKDMAVGVSAAIGIRKFMGVRSSSITTYMTGNIWPAAVRDFQVSAYGFADYNSSDIVCSADKKEFYGISLKKKGTVKAADPTLINKAFDTVFDGPEFMPLKSELIIARTDYFASLIKEAVKKKIILKEDINNYNSLSNEDLFKSKGIDKTKFGSGKEGKGYIDTKGYADADGGYLNDNTKDPKSMRKFVNNKLSKKTGNKLWEKIEKLINKGSEKLASELINIILKINLDSEIDSKKLEGKRFVFALMTGIGDVKKDKKIFIGPAKTFPLKTTLCGLQRINDKNKGLPYKIVQDADATRKSDAAKIFFTLKKGNMKIMNLEIRYKGSFTSQPQFQGSMTKEFKKEIEKECSG